MPEVIKPLEWPRQGLIWGAREISISYQWTVEREGSSTLDSWDLVDSWDDLNMSRY